MQLYNKLFEKFTDEDSDPIRDMNIGVGGPKNFKNLNDALIFLVEIIPFILKTKEIPRDIISDPSYIINIKYSSKIFNYYYKYFSVNGNSETINLYLLRDLLSKKLKKSNIVKESLNEKFTEYSDPINDLEIGIMHEIKEWMKSIHYNFLNKNVALNVCVQHGKINFIKYLLENGADVHYMGDSALRHAVVSGFSEVVKLLLDAGADAHINDNLSLRLASYYGHEDIVKMLKDHIVKEKKLKKIKESLNEKFTDEDSDPIADMGIGIKRKIEDWLKEMKIFHIVTIDKNLIINSYNPEHDIYLSEKMNGNFPDYIQFGIVKGYFSCSMNNMTSLRGCPKEVYEHFYCYKNNLTSLKYCPEYVGRNFVCKNNAKKFSIKYINSLCNCNPELIEN